MIKLLIFFLGLVLGFALRPCESLTIKHTISKDEYYFRLRALKLFLKNQLRCLNSFFGCEYQPDETDLINSIPRYEYQIEQIDNILTAYGKIKEVQNAE